MGPSIGYDVVTDGGRCPLHDMERGDLFIHHTFGLCMRTMDERFSPSVAAVSLQNGRLFCPDELVSDYCPVKAVSTLGVRYENDES